MFEPVTASTRPPFDPMISIESQRTTTAETMALRKRFLVWIPAAMILVFKVVSRSTMVSSGKA